MNSYVRIYLRMLLFLLVWVQPMMPTCCRALCVSTHWYATLVAFLMQTDGELLQLSQVPADNADIRSVLERCLGRIDHGIWLFNKSPIQQVTSDELWYLLCLLDHVMQRLLVAVPQENQSDWSDHLHEQVDELRTQVYRSLELPSEVNTHRTTP